LSQLESLTCHMQNVPQGPSVVDVEVVVVEVVLVLVVE
jgi:hypothetical protein